MASPTPPVASFELTVTQFAVDPIRPRIYATDLASNSLYVFDTSTLELVKTFALGPLPRGLALSADSSRLYVANSDDAAGYLDYTISVIDLESLSLLPELHIPYGPQDLEEGLDGRLYVSTAHYPAILPDPEFGQAHIFQVDSSTGEVTGYVGINVGATPSFLEISSDRKTLYSGSQSYGGGIVGKYNVSSPTAVTLQTVAQFQGRAGGLVLSSDNTFLCYASGLDDPDLYPPPVALVTADLNEVKGGFDFEGSPLPYQAIALSPDSSVAYHGVQPNGSDERIVLTSTSSFRNLSTIIVTEPEDYQYAIANALAVDQGGRYLFVAKYPNILVYDVSPRLESAPVISGLMGSPFSYQLLSTFDPTAFSAVNLPPGLTINQDGTVSGIPTQTGTYDVVIIGSRAATEVSTSYTFRIDGTRLKNISTRAFVQPNDFTIIGGFIIDGIVAKDVVVRLLGPSLAAFGLNPAKNPAFRLYDGQGLEVRYNNDWAAAGDDTAEVLKATGLAPSEPVEAATLIRLEPGPYTVVAEPGGGGLVTDYNGIALFEVYDVDENTLSRLGNISTRAFVGPIDPEIAGFIVIGLSADAVLIRGVGPSLAEKGVPNPLGNPVLELHDAQGALLARNDDWKDEQEMEIAATGLAPTNGLEPAILALLPEGAYTAVFQGSNLESGICLAEVYHLP